MLGANLALGRALWFKFPIAAGGSNVALLPRGGLYLPQNEKRASTLLTMKIHRVASSFRFMKKVAT